MSHTQIYVHVVFAVKKRAALLPNDKRVVLFNHIKDEARHHHINIVVLNGYEDHVHVLLRLSPTQVLSTVMQRIKGESSWWANQLRLFDVKLTWAKGYFARSVDPDNVSMVIQYITAQPYKHQTSFPWLHTYLQTILEEEPSD